MGQAGSEPANTFGQASNPDNFYSYLDKNQTSIYFPDVYDLLRPVVNPLVFENFGNTRRMEKTYLQQYTDGGMNLFYNTNGIAVEAPTVREDQDIPGYVVSTNQMTIRVPRDKQSVIWMGMQSGFDAAITNTQSYSSSSAQGNVGAASRLKTMATNDQEYQIPATFIAMNIQIANGNDRRPNPQFPVVQGSVFRSIGLDDYASISANSFNHVPYPGMTQAHLDDIKAAKPIGYSGAHATAVRTRFPQMGWEHYVRYLVPETTNYSQYVFVDLDNQSRFKETVVPANFKLFSMDDWETAFEMIMANVSFKTALLQFYLLPTVEPLKLWAEATVGGWFTSQGGDSVVFRLPRYDFVDHVCEYRSTLILHSGPALWPIDQIRPFLRLLVLVKLYSYQLYAKVHGWCVALQNANFEIVFPNGSRPIQFIDPMYSYLRNYNGTLLPPRATFTMVPWELPIMFEGTMPMDVHSLPHSKWVGKTVTFRDHTVLNNTQISEQECTKFSRWVAKVPVGHIVDYVDFRDQAPTTSYRGTGMWVYGYPIFDSGRNDSDTLTMGGSIEYGTFHENDLLTFPAQRKMVNNPVNSARSRNVFGSGLNLTQ